MIEIKCDGNGRFHYKDYTTPLLLHIWKSSPTNFSANINGKIEWFRNVKLAEKWLKIKYLEYMESIK